jgi:hypothetical protein
MLPIVKVLSLVWAKLRNIILSLKQAKKKLSNFLQLTIHNSQLTIHGYTTLFQLSLTELAASTTSLNPIINAPNVGLKKPNAATGIAIML